MNATASASSPRHRIGVVLDSLHVPAWIAEVLVDIQASKRLELSLLIVHGHRRKSAGQRFPFRAWATLLFDLYEWFDYRLFKARRDALALVDVRSVVADAPVCHLVPAPIDANGSQGHIPAPIDQIRPDLIVHLAAGAPCEKLIASAALGLLTIHYGRQKYAERNRPMFWEIYEGDSVTETTLKVWTKGRPGGQPVWRSFSATKPLSLCRTRNATYWRTADHLVRCLRTSTFAAVDSFEPHPSATEEKSSAVDGPTPTNGVMARFLGRLILSLARQQGSKLFFVESRPWILAIRKRQPGAMAGEGNSGFQLITPPDGRFYADPCIFKKDGTNYLFFEDYSYAGDKGVISYCQLDEVGNCSEPRPALERDYHLSYPFLFQWQDQVYMVPETGANQTIELYRAVQFPDRWVLDRVLMENVHAADSTILHHDGRFWLFTTLGVPGCPNDESLYLFFADSLEGAWRPHRKNPIVADVRRARPAGRLFFANGQLIRPAQDCSGCYGHAITFNRVHVLSEEEYHEVPMGRLDPAWLPGSLATHTLSFNEDFEVRDARLLLSRPRWGFLSRFGRQRSPRTEMNSAPVGSGLGLALHRSAMHEGACAVSGADRFLAGEV